MYDCVHPKRLIRAPRARLLTVAALMGAGPVAAAISASSAAGAHAATTGRAHVASAGSTGAGSKLSQEVAFAKCMRANGVPNFPDPTSNGDFLLHPGPGGVDPDSPALSAAMSKCLKLHPVSGMLGLDPGASTNPSPQALAQMLTISQCMRSHGISWFPDPGTHIPSRVTGLVANQNGVIYVFTPSDVEQMHGSAYGRAANRCGHGRLGKQLPNH